MSTVKVVNNIHLAVDAINRASRRGLTASAIYVQGRASEYAPVDTGRLRASIAKDVHDEYALVGTNVEYAPYVELGTARQTAQPFLRPALDNNRTKIQAIFYGEYNKELK